MKSPVATLLLAVAGGAMLVLAAPAAVIAADAAPTKTADPVPPKPAASGTDKAPADEPLVVTLGDKDAQAVGPVEVGHKIEVRTRVNASLPVSWGIKEIKGDAVRAGESKAVPAPPGPGPEMVGRAPFTLIFPFEAVKAGKAEVTFGFGYWTLDAKGKRVPASISRTVALTFEVQAADAPKPAPEGKGAAAPPPAKRANPVPITGKGDPQAPGYIVLFENNVDAKAEVARLEKLYGFAHKYVYDMPTFKGFAAVMTDAAIEQVRWETSIHSIEHDGTVSVSGGGMGVQ